MKIIILLLALFAAFSFTRLEAQTNADGYLVFEIDRYTYDMGKPGGTDVKQSFKVPLTAEFMAQFKHTPNQNSSGTGFLCAGGSPKPDSGETSFMWWIRQTVDHRWAINMWGEGFETLDGTPMQSHNPVVSQDVVIKHLEDLDMQYMLSYNGKDTGMNIAFKVTYVPARDIDANGVIPVAPVKKADGKDLFPGDDSSKLPLKLHCLFQEG
jgi:hypothetical protein